MKSIVSRLSVTVTVLIAHVALAQPAKEIVKDFLDENVLIVVPVATNRVTTISFSSAITAIDGAGVTADGKTPGLFQLAHTKGSAFLSVRALFPKASANLNIRWNEHTYVFELTESDHPVLSLNLEAPPTPEEAGVGHAPQVSPLTLLALLDKATLEARLLFSEPSDYGWWYLCPDQMNRAMVCLVTDAEAARTLGLIDPRRWMEGFASTKLFAQLKFDHVIENVNAATIGFSFLKARHGNCWIANGDAAVRLDPLGSCGTMRALDSGRRAAIVVSTQLRGDANGIGAYEKWSENLIREFNRQRQKQYSIEQSNRSHGFWTRRTMQSTVGELAIQV